MSYIPCVVAALIECNQKYYICKRPLNKCEGGKFEFPGGKVKPNESHQEALVRECKEELDITIKVKDLFYCWSEQSSGQQFPIYFYFATLLEGEPTLLEHTEGFFAYPLQMNSFPFAPADMAVVKKLQALPASPSPLFTHCIWDFDGTLFNSYPQINKAMALTLSFVGVKENPKELASLLKVSVGKTIAEMAKKHSISEDLFSIYQKFERSFPLDHLALYPGMKELLLGLYQGGVKHYIYTHRGKSTFDYLKHYNLLSLFDDVITSENNFASKPAPDAINWLVKKHNLPKEKTIMIGDRAIDVYSGYNADIQGAFLDLDQFFSQDQIPADIPLRFDTINAFEDFLWGK